MKGFMYRTAMRIKDYGERLKLGPLIRLGLWAREKALRFSVGDMMT
jgi:hypothetical protein